ncbi:hypothetical protein I302_106981 [Kwoniella bestiolae CBS 10118]|uniref:F-box domain-containing protein n=1 Tax=Kwoniella bestiolae CBS 10118 TaxID=1296100 RepID=A0A1B9FZV0_9TREE|nr:hypothetical protein I302_05755 [Kwoniella bestiolae CBS 10118]OCF24296.1 hypothetical protein I302_05755 [Kwoniella bestiolae CBS 10118]
MNDPSNPFQSPSNNSTAQPRNQLLSKVGQPSTSSPRTESNNRKRFGGLFASFGLGNGTGSPLRPPVRTPVRAGKPSQVKTNVRDEKGDEEGEGDDNSNVVGGVWSFAERMRELTLGSPAKGKGSEIDVDVGVRKEGKVGDGLMGLPDEILLHVLLQLPSTLAQLHLISLISTRFYDLSRTPVLWSNIFRENGFELNEAARRHGVAVEYPPDGHWEGMRWLSDVAQEDQEHSKHQEQEGSLLQEGDIPIHYPTLIRSRLTLQHLIDHPDHLPTPTVMEGHHDVVYCLARYRNHLFTGSRDRSIRLYNVSTRKSIWVEEAAHARSVLCLDLELDEYGRGLLVSGSSDTCIGVWTVDLSGLDSNSPSPEAGKQALVLERLTTIQCTSSVLSIALTPQHVISATKDNKITIYSKSSYEIVRTLEGHTQPVNSISLSPDRTKLVSGSGDGTWKIWDLSSGVLEREGGGGRGVACVEWKGDHIVSGDGDNLVKLYSASTGNLLHALEGHRDLVRSVSINHSARVIVSASYDKTIRMWDIRSGKLIKIINEDRSSLVFDLTMVPNKIIATRQDGSVHVFTFGDDLPYTNLFA